MNALIMGVCAGLPVQQAGQNWQDLPSAEVIFVVC